VKETRLAGLAVPPAAESPATRVVDATGSAAAAASEAPGAKAAIGKATVERMISDTRTQGRRTTAVAVAVVALLALGGATWLRFRSADDAATARQLASDAAARADSIG